jgi:hypothetical protein
MSNLDAAFATLVGTEVYFTLDWTKDYWQLVLHPESQEYFSFMTPFGVYTPTRVLMGQTDAVAHCMSVVTKLFGDLLFRGLLAWIDDFLGAAKTVDELFDLLDKVLSICAKCLVSSSTRTSAISSCKKWSGVARSCQRLALLILHVGSKVWPIWSRLSQ